MASSHITNHPMTTDDVTLVTLVTPAWRVMHTVNHKHQPRSFFKSRAYHPIESSVQLRAEFFLPSSPRSVPPPFSSNSSSHLLHSPTPSSFPSLFSPDTVHRLPVLCKPGSLIPLGCNLAQISTTTVRLRLYPRTRTLPARQFSPGHTPR